MTEGSICPVGGIKNDAAKRPTAAMVQNHKPIVVQGRTFRVKARNFARRRALLELLIPLVIGYNV